MSRFLRFAIVGGIGFTVDAALLSLLLWTTALGPYWARLISIAVATTVTWLCNRRLTFAPSGRSLLSEGTRYGGVGITSSVVNYLIYSGLLVALDWVPPVAAMVAATAVSMMVSYLGYSRLVFGRQDV